MKEIIQAQITEEIKGTELTELEMITTMQGLCAKINDESTLEVLCEMKRDILGI